MTQAEFVLRYGYSDWQMNGQAPPPIIMIVPPLFDEANRMRRTLVLTMRALAELGYDSMMPDLPGLNDSLVPTVAVTIDQWRAELASVAAQQARPLICVAIRSGCLIDGDVLASGWWRLAPVTGASLLRTMMRARVAGDREVGVATSMESLRDQAHHDPIELVGNMLSPAMIAQIEQATPTTIAPLRSVSLGVGPDHIAGSALWLRAEPGEDAPMALAMATDIAAWAKQCAAA